MKNSKTHESLKEFSGEVMNRVIELEELHKQKLELESKEEELSRPLLTDMEHIPLILKWLRELSEADGKRGNMTGETKQKFIYIFLALYAPVVLIGESSIPAGLRRKIAQAFNYKAPSAVSNLCRDIMFRYKNDKYFRKDVIRYGEEVW